MSPLKNKLIIQKKTQNTKSYLRKICQKFTFQQTCRKNYVLRDTSCFNMYNGRVLLSRHAVQLTRVGNAARLFHDNSHLKGLRGICPGNACSWDTCGTPGRKNKVIISTTENKSQPYIQGFGSGSVSGSGLIWAAGSGSGSAYKLRIRIRIQEGKNGPKKLKKGQNYSSFEVLDVLFWGLKASPVAWASFMEA